MKALSNLKPISVVRATEIEGYSFPIHEFPAEEWDRLAKPLREPEDELTVDEMAQAGLNLVIHGIEGGDYTPTEEDRRKIKSMLSHGVIREYMHRLCQLNDFGLDAVQAAEKNYAAAQSSATK